MADDDAATLILKPRLLRLFWAVWLLGFAALIASNAIYAVVERGIQALGEAAILLLVSGVLLGVFVRRVRSVTIALSPAGVRVITGRRIRTAQWNDVTAVSVGCLSQWRGVNEGMVVVTKSGQTIKFYDDYRPGRDVVFKFLSDYANAHTAHVLCARQIGPSGGSWGQLRPRNRT